MSESARPPMDRVIKAAEALTDAVKEAFAETRHVHRLDTQVAQMVVAEITITLTKPEYQWAYQVLGDHFRSQNGNHGP